MCILKADSGASKYLLKSTDKTILKNIIQDTSTQVVIPDTNHLQTTQAGFLPIHPSLSTMATRAQVLPGMKNSLLLSISQLCDDGCIAVFNKLHLHIF